LDTFKRAPPILKLEFKLLTLVTTCIGWSEELPIHGSGEDVEDEKADAANIVELEKEVWYRKAKIDGDRFFAKQVPVSSESQALQEVKSKLYNFQHLNTHRAASLGKGASPRCEREDQEDLNMKRV
jgi:hypothetical protein